MSLNEIKIAELFAGVGGFRLGLDGYHNPDFPEFDMPSAGPYTTIWANNWEPPGTDSRQFAARCYETRFGKNSIVNEDINKVLNDFESGKVTIPDVDMVVGGFPCQDYSVAKPLSKAGGIEGKKGVLWWDIYRFLQYKSPRFVLLENVDRLLKSPASQRGRDFSIILSCFATLGYAVEWRVVNSAEYGCAQRRKRVYIFAVKTEDSWDLFDRLMNGVLGTALPIQEIHYEDTVMFDIPQDPYEATRTFGKNQKKSIFDAAGIMQNNHAITCPITEKYDGVRRSLRNVLIPEESVPEQFYIDNVELPKWEYLKGSKSEERVNKASGFTYHYSEGKMAFPDSLDKPSRTILTGEGGKGASRFKHVIQVNGRYRRLTPDELDQLQGFPKGWTNTGMSDGNRAFCMGNALVTDIPHQIGKAITKLYLD